MPPAADTPAEPSAWRAWCYLVRLSFQRQARAHLMVWIALGLLGLTMIIVGANTQAGRWSMVNWSHPRGKGPTYKKHVENLATVGSLPWGAPEASIHQMAQA